MIAYLSLAFFDDFFILIKIADNESSFRSTSIFDGRSYSIAMIVASSFANLKSSAAVVVEFHSFRVFFRHRTRHEDDSHRFFAAAASDIDQT